MEPDHIGINFSPKGKHARLMVAHLMGVWDIEHPTSAAPLQKYFVRISPLPIFVEQCTKFSTFDGTTGFTSEIELLCMNKPVCALLEGKLIIPPKCLKTTSLSLLSSLHLNFSGVTSLKARNLSLTAH